MHDPQALEIFGGMMLICTALICSMVFVKMMMQYFLARWVIKTLLSAKVLIETNPSDEGDRFPRPKK